MSDSVRQAAFHSREIQLCWPLPLSFILWLLIVLKFGNTLSSPSVKTAISAPIEASFIELSDVALGKKLQKQSKLLPMQAVKTQKITRPVVTPDNGTAAASPLPAKDFLAHVNAGMERLRAAEMTAAREYAEARVRARAPSADEIRTANIMRNLQPQGTNGVFEIIRIGAQTAQYSFRGWISNSTNPRHEYIEIDAGAGGDVERAIVRSMITLIREYYKGDFNWESQRLQRVIVLSARMEDNAGLEDFLLREFFSASDGLHGHTSRNGIQ